MKTFLKFGVLLAVTGCIGGGLWLLRPAAAAPQAPATAAALTPAQAPGVLPPVWLPRVARYLHLTPDQRQQLAQLRVKHRAAIDAIRRDPSLTPEQKRARVRQERGEALAEAGKLLTPDQLARLQRIRNFVFRSGFRVLAQREEMVREHRFWGGPQGRGPSWQRPFGPPPGGPGGFARNFPSGGNLTPEQRIEIDRVTQAYREQVRQILGGP
jgi:Spy/CpxP family protein refolding chaperone